MGKLLKFFMLIVVVIPLTGCESDDDDEPGDPSNVPSISSISPTSGPFNTLVTIKGSNFISTHTQTTVSFNGEGAQIVSFSNNEIVARVPSRCGTGPVKVNNGDDVTVGPVFTYEFTVTVSTFSGDGVAGFIDGAAATARYNKPAGLSMDENGNVYVADEMNHRIRRISSNGFVTSIAGNGLAGHFDGTPANSKFHNPSGVAYDKITGTVYVADKMNHCIRQVQINTVNTVSGVPNGPGYVDGATNLARYFMPYDLEVQSEDADLYVADGGNNCIRKLDITGLVSTFAGTNSPGLTDGNGTSARFNTPVSITFDSAGYFYVTDNVNHNIRSISLNADVTSAAGSGAPGFVDGNTPLAQFNGPSSISIKNGVGLIVDKNNHSIRGISIDGNDVTTIAGNGTAGYVDGPGAQARFSSPGGIVHDGDGTYYVSDTDNHVIRKVVLE